MAASIVEAGQGRNEVLPDLGGECEYPSFGGATLQWVEPVCLGSAAGALAADELCPAADWQGHSLRVRGDQTVTTA